MRLPVEIIRRVREAVGEDFIVVYRLSHAGPWSRAAPTLAEVVALAKAIEGSRRDHHQHRHRLAPGPHPHHRHLHCRAAHTWVGQSA